MEWLDRSTGEVIDLSQPDGPIRALLAQQHTIERLGDRLDMLTGRVEALPDIAGGGSDGLVDAVSGWSWRDLGPLGARVLWDRLAAWVGWLRGRYPLAEQIPPCWWRHPELVEELTALWLAWRAAYSDPAAVMTMPAEWHDRWLPGALHRVKAWGVHCGAEHRDRPPSVYDARSVDEPDAFAALVSADIEARQATPSEPAHTAKPEGPMSITATEMTTHIATGSAVQLGGLPGSPIEYDDVFWIETPRGWMRVVDADMDAQLRRDRERLALADEAVRRAQDENPS